jgi:hypothetical protein
MLQKNTLPRLLPGFYLLPLPALLLALSRYSYRAKELLACWLLFCSFFVFLAVLFLASVLACYAIHHLLDWMNMAKPVIPELAACLADIPQEVIPGLPILATGTFKLSTDTYATVDAFDSDASLSVKVARSAMNEQTSKTEQTLFRVRPNMQEPSKRSIGQAKG